MFLAVARITVSFQRPDTRLDRGSGDGAPSYNSCRSRLCPAMFLALPRIIVTFRPAQPSSARVSAGRWPGISARGRELAVRQYSGDRFGIGVFSPIRVNRQKDRSKLPRTPGWA